MGRIVVDEDRCKGCEVCLSVCPKKVIAMADHFNRLGYRPARMHETVAKVAVAVVSGTPQKETSSDESRSSDECTGCTLCARMCPDVAITVYR